MKFPEYRPFGGAVGRWRREMRRRVLEPLLVGHRSFRETVLNAVAARGHLIYCDLPQGRFFVDPSDRVIGTHLTWYGNWQFGELERGIAILRGAGRLPTAAVFVDVGANIGTHTVFALNTGDFARAICFEPEPTNLRLLEMNIAANEMGSRASIVAAAVGAESGTVTLHLHPRNKGGHSITHMPATDGSRTIEVPLVCLDEALTQAGISVAEIGIVCIDVEGAEPAAVKGLGRYLGQVPLMIEYAPKRYTPAARRALNDILSANYRHLYRLDGAEPRAEAVTVVEEFVHITEILVF